MKLAIEKGKLSLVINMLDDLSLKGKKSRHRTKLKKKLVEGYEVFLDEEKEMIKENTHLDENGNPKTIEEGKLYDVIDVDEFVKAKKELYEEEYIVDDADFAGAIETVKEIMLKLDKELSGKDADAYDYFCEKLEEATAK